MHSRPLIPIGSCDGQQWSTPGVDASTFRQLINAQTTPALSDPPNTPVWIRPGLRYPMTQDEWNLHLMAMERLSHQVHAQAFPPGYQLGFTEHDCLAVCTDNKIVLLNTADLFDVPPDRTPLARLESDKQFRELMAAAGLSDRDDTTPIFSSECVSSNCTPRDIMPSFLHWQNDLRLPSQPYCTPSDPKLGRNPQSGRSELQAVQSCSPATSFASKYFGNSGSALSGEADIRDRRPEVSLGIRPARVIQVAQRVVVHSEPEISGATSNHRYWQEEPPKSSRDLAQNPDLKNPVDRLADLETTSYARHASRSSNPSIPEIRGFGRENHDGQLPCQKTGSRSASRSESNPTRDRSFPGLSPTDAASRRLAAEQGLTRPPGRAPIIYENAVPALKETDVRSQSTLGGRMVARRGRALENPCRAPVKVADTKDGRNSLTVRERDGQLLDARRLNAATPTPMAPTPCSTPASDFNYLIKRPCPTSISKKLAALWRSTKKDSTPKPRVVEIVQSDFAEYGLQFLQNHLEPLYPVPTFVGPEFAKIRQLWEQPTPECAN